MGGRRGQLRSSRSTSSARSSKAFPEPPVVWNFQGMRGKMSSNCLWHSCQAFFLGLILFTLGAGMSALGFYSDGLFDSYNRANLTITIDHHINPIKFSKWSYAGPIVMGVGGFIIVATCVLTFEARDSAAKVGPAKLMSSALRKSVDVMSVTSGTATALLPNPSKEEFIFRERPLPRREGYEVRSVASQTVDALEDIESNSLNNLNLLNKRLLLEKFKKFSKAKQSPTLTTSISYEFDGEIHRCPSAPNLKQSDIEKPIFPVPIHGRRGSRVPAAFLRQTMSVDYSLEGPKRIKEKFLPKKGVLKCSGNQSGNFGSLERNLQGHQGQVDLHTPNGVVTLNVGITGGEFNDPSVPSTSNKSKKLSFYQPEEVSSPVELIQFSKSPNFGVKKRQMSAPGGMGRPLLQRQSGLDKVESGESILEFDENSSEEEEVKNDIPKV